MTQSKWQPQPCNLCGEPCGCNHKHASALGLVNHTEMGSYCSTPGNGCGALDDGATYTFSLCEFCLDWLFSRFKIPPEVDRGDPESNVFRPAEQRVNEDDWRQLGRERFFSEFHKRNKARAT